MKKVPFVKAQKEENEEDNVQKKEAAKRCPFKEQFLK